MCRFIVRVQTRHEFVFFQMEHHVSNVTENAQVVGAETQDMICRYVQSTQYGVDKTEDFGKKDMVVVSNVQQVPHGFKHHRDNIHVAKFVYSVTACAVATFGSRPSGSTVWD